VFAHAGVSPSHRGWLARIAGPTRGPNVPMSAKIAASTDSLRNSGEACKANDSLSKTDATARSVASLIAAAASVIKVRCRKLLAAPAIAARAAVRATVAVANARNPSATSAATWASRLAVNAYWFRTKLAGYLHAVHPMDKARNVRKAIGSEFTSN